MVRCQHDPWKPWEKQQISRVKRYKLNCGRAADKRGRQGRGHSYKESENAKDLSRDMGEPKQIQGEDERQTMMGNCGKSWKVDKPRDRQAGRQMAREREWWANSQRSRQTTRERKKLPASEGGADRQAGIIAEASR